MFSKTKLMGVKKVKKAAIVVVLTVLILLVPAALVFAQETVTEGDINRVAGSLEIPRGTVVNGNVTVNMGEIVILGTVNGNVTGDMGRVVIHGDVNGNVEASMGQVILTGNVSGDVRASMGEVTIDGVVAGSLTTSLGDVTIRGTVGGNVDTGLGVLRIPGEVLGSVSSLGKTVSVTGTVGGDINLTRGIVDLGAQSKVDGRIVVEEGLVKVREGAQAASIEVVEELTEAEVNRLFQSNGYRFFGVDDFAYSISDGIERVFREPFYHLQNLRSTWKISPFPFMHWQGRLGHGLFSMVVAFAFSALTITLFPRQVRTAGRAITEKTGAVIGWGILGALLAVPLIILLAITIIGIPLILVLVLLYAAAGLLGYTALTLIIGEKLLKPSAEKEVNPLTAIVLGVLILGVLTMIPVLGALLGLIVSLTALGAAVTTRLGSVSNN